MARLDTTHVTVTLAIRRDVAARLVELDDVCAAATLGDVSSDDVADIAGALLVQALEDGEDTFGARLDEPLERVRTVQIGGRA